MAFAKKLHLDTGLVNQMVDRLAIPASKVQKCSCSCGSGFAADTLHIFPG